MLFQKNIKTVSGVVQGASHKKDNKPLQDARPEIYILKRGMFSYIGGILAIADGHGGAKYIRSKQGADIAVKIAVSCLHSFYEKNHTLIDKVSAQGNKQDIYFLEKNIYLLKAKVITEWRKAVLNDFNQNKLTDDEKQLCIDEGLLISTRDNSNSEDTGGIYGTTLIAGMGLVAPPFWLGIKIGDGQMSVINTDNSITHPIPDNEKNIANVTCSLCSGSAIEDFQHGYGFNSFKGLFLSTDGVVNSFSTDSNYYEQFILQVYNWTNTKNETDPEKTITEQLSKISEAGSGDDASIAGLFYGGASS